MTREEAITILKEGKLFRMWDTQEQDEEALRMAIDALQDDWIPVSERLPKEYDQYLCYCEGGDCYVYWLENKPWAEETVEKEGIIAWQPLPAPYKESDKE